jgi:DNA-directed RNA polymerase specialized sigma subunit
MHQHNLSHEHRDICIGIIKTTNALLTKWESHFPKVKFRQFRQSAFHNPEELAKLLPTLLQDEFRNDCNTIGKVLEVRADLDSRNVEQTIMDGYTQMAYFFANKYAKRNAHRGLAVEDYSQEALFQIVEAIYRWKPDGAANLTTYLFHSIFNRLNRVTNEQGSLLSHHTNESIRLVSLYRKALAKLGADKPFEEIVKHLKLTKKQIKNLSASLVQVTTETSHSPESEASWIENAPATTVRSVVGDPSELVASDEFLSKVFKSANLSQMELDLIITSMEPYHGFQKDVGDKYHTADGRPFSRMRVSQIHRIAREKIQRAIERLREKE